MLDIDHIIHLIVSKGYSCGFVEKQLGFGNGAIRRWSINSPSVSKLYALSNFLKIPIAELLAEKSVYSDDEKKLLDYYRSLSDDDKITALGDLIRFATQKKNNAETAADLAPKAPDTAGERKEREIAVAAYGGGVFKHKITATDEELRRALEEDEQEDF